MAKFNYRFWKLGLRNRRPILRRFVSLSNTDIWGYIELDLLTGLKNGLASMVKAYNLEKLGVEQDMLRLANG